MVPRRSRWPRSWNGSCSAKRRSARHRPWPKRRGARWKPCSRRMRMKTAKQAGLLGASLDVLIVDEADKLRDACWDEALAARTVDRDARVLLISTPGNTSSWFFKEFRRGGRDADYESFSMPTSTNPHISPAVIEAERGRLDPETIGAHFDAKFIGQDLVPCDVCLGPRVDASCVTCLYVDEQPKS